MKKRIVILGPSGTGKTTLGKMLSEKLNIAHYPLDSLYWLPYWNSIDKSLFKLKIFKIMQKHDEWVMDGNYSSQYHFDLRLKMATDIIYLAYGKQMSLKGVFERADRFKHRVRFDMAKGCFEGVDQDFLRYIHTFEKNQEPFILAKVRKYKSKNIHIFKNRTDMYKWLEKV
jgi:adenylate kinase family enzyme